jgi:hypothetical protein
MKSEFIAYGTFTNVMYDCFQSFSYELFYIAWLTVTVCVKWELKKIDIHFEVAYLFPLKWIYCKKKHSDQRTS